MALAHTSSLGIVDGTVLAERSVARLTPAEVSGWTDFAIALLGEQLYEPRLVFDLLVLDA
jgi:hypothetical protein